MRWIVLKSPDLLINMRREGGEGCFLELELSSGIFVPGFGGMVRFFDIFLG